MLRPVGHLERLLTSKHSLGYYRSIANTTRYSTDQNVENLPGILENAIVKTILQHPILCSGVINEDKSDPTFIRLESIDLKQCIEYKEITVSTVAEYEEGLSKMIEHQHSQLWPDLHRLPGWKVIIVQSNIWSPQTIFDLVFAYHHGFADGLSGMVFHKTLLQALKNTNNEFKLSNHLLPIPENLNLLPPVEKLIDFKNSEAFLLKTINNPAYLSTDPIPSWGAKPCSLRSSEEFKSRIKIISIPVDTVTGTLAACRKKNTTATGLLHSIIVASLAFRVPTAQSFSSATPYSLRRLTSTSTKDAMFFATSSLPSTYDPETVSSLRSTASNPALFMDQMWKIASEFRTSMTEEMAHQPNDNPVGLLPFVPDFHEFHSSKMDKPRKNTYELSNLGVFEKRGEGVWKVERMAFSQSGDVNGGALHFSVATVSGGPLTVCITWQEGIVEEGIVDGVVDDLKNALEDVGRGDVVRMGGE